MAFMPKPSMLKWMVPKIFAFGVVRVFTSVDYIGQRNDYVPGKNIPCLSAQMDRDKNVFTQFSTIG